MRPHPHLTAYYRTDAQKRAFLDDLFNRNAVHYDRIGRLLSLGTMRWYRRFALAQAGLRPGMQMLDVASGTGLLARAAVAVTGGPAGVIALEPSAAMVREGRKATSVRFVRGLAESLPFQDESFHLVSMAYALRHVPDLVNAFREFRRVLRPCGKLLILELSRPSSRAGFVIMRFHIEHLVPWLLRTTTGKGDAKQMMRYYWETITQCAPAETILNALRSSGFDEVKCRAYVNVITEYHAQRSRA